VASLRGIIGVGREHGRGLGLGGATQSNATQVENKYIWRKSTNYFMEHLQNWLGLLYSIAGKNWTHISVHIVHISIGRIIKNNINHNTT